MHKTCLLQVSAHPVVLLQCRCLLDDLAGGYSETGMRAAAASPAPHPAHSAVGSPAYTSLCQELSASAAPRQYRCSLSTCRRARQTPALLLGQTALCRILRHTNTRRCAQSIWAWRNMCVVSAFHFAQTLRSVFGATAQALAFVCGAASADNLPDHAMQNTCVITSPPHLPLAPLQ